MTSTHLDLYLNSSQATNYLNDDTTYKSNMVFLFNTPIIPPLGYDMVMKLKNMYLPMTMYLINDTNNTIGVYINSNNYSATLTNGNYTALTLGTELTTQMNNIGFGTWTVSFDTSNNKFTFTNDSYEFAFSYQYSTCLSIIGFDDSEDTSYSSSYTLTSSYPIDLTGENMLYVDVANLKTFNMSSTTSSTTSNIASIPINVPYGSVLYYENNQNSGCLIQEDNISFIHIKLYGEDGETLLNLQNFDWSMTLEVKFITKKQQPTISKSMRDIYTKYISNLINK